MAAPRPRGRALTPLGRRLVWLAVPLAIVLFAWMRAERHAQPTFLSPWSYLR